MVDNANSDRDEKRRNFVYSVLIGQEVLVTVRCFCFSLTSFLGDRCVIIHKKSMIQMMDGAKYKGVLSKIDTKEIVLRMACLVFDGLQEVKFAKPEGTKTVASSVWKMIQAMDVKIGAADLGPVGAMDDAGGFGTDAAISRGRGGKEGRELERWNAETDLVEGGLEEMDSRADRGWDQFALNEARFGVKTDYKEEYYTTELDYSKSKISIEEANRIAAEIEKGGSSTTNIHMLEERGIDVDDVDEEARYGAVLRGAHPVRRDASKSIPINARKETNKVRAHMTGSKPSSPYGTPKLESPLIGDAKTLEALNLDPGVGSSKVDDETRRQFEAFKMHTNKKKQETEKKKSSLNPNAKSFSFNVDAKEFNPGASFKPSTQPKYVSDSGPPPPPPPMEMHAHMGMYQQMPGYGMQMHGNPYYVSRPLMYPAPMSAAVMVPGTGPMAPHGSGSDYQGGQNSRKGPGKPRQQYE